METIAFISGCLGIALSTLGITTFTVREHRVEKRRTLSELAARDKKTLKEFRIILWTCGTLISVMMYLLVIPNISSGLWFAVTYTVIIGAELSLAVIPARGDKLKVHEYIAYSMGTGMLILALSFGASLTGTYALLEYAIFGLMTLLCIFTIRYWERFIYFELPFIFLSHMSILIAAVAVL